MDAVIAVGITHKHFLAVPTLFLNWNWSGSMLIPFHVATDGLVIIPLNIELVMFT